MKRLFNELNTIRSHLSDTTTKNIITLHPISSDDLYSWEALIIGPVDSPYDNHNFTLRIDIPPNYPTVPPTCKFLSRKMPHVNVDYVTGKICLDILDTNWSPIYNLWYIVNAIVRLLNEPNANSPLNLELGCLYRINDISGYYGLINYYLSEKKYP